MEDENEESATNDRIGRSYLSLCVRARTIPMTPKAS